MHKDFKMRNENGNRTVEKLISNMKGWVTHSEAELVCPWCGYEYETCDVYGLDEGDTEDVKCYYCGNHFDLEIETRRKYRTKRSLCGILDDYAGDKIL